MQRGKEQLAPSIDGLIDDRTRHRRLGLLVTRCRGLEYLIDRRGWPAVVRFRIRNSNEIPIQAAPRNPEKRRNLTP
jgi:hypothetical protein